MFEADKEYPCLELPWVVTPGVLTSTQFVGMHIEDVKSGGWTEIDALRLRHQPAFPTQQGEGGLGVAALEHATNSLALLRNIAAELLKPLTPVNAAEGQHRLWRGARNLEISTRIQINVRAPPDHLKGNNEVEHFKAWACRSSSSRGGGLLPRPRGGSRGCALC
jgi:hypothetical protein